MRVGSSAKRRRVALPVHSSDLFSPLTRYKLVVGRGKKATQMPGGVSHPAPTPDLVPSCSRTGQQLRQRHFLILYGMPRESLRSTTVLPYCRTASPRNLTSNCDPPVHTDQASSSSRSTMVPALPGTAEPEFETEHAFFASCSGRCRQAGR